MISKNQKAVLLSPPGGMMIWIFIFSELAIYGMALAAFMYQRQANLDMFIDSRKQLNQFYGTANTSILLLSGFFMAVATSLYEKKSYLKARKNIIFAAALGLLFLVLKLFEYYEKIELGLGLGANTFFDFYWVLTSFHAIHVLIGLVILGILAIKVGRNTPFPHDDFNLHTGANYWHMCDLIWVLIFPIIYLF